MDPITLARAALTEAKAAFDKDGSQANLEVLEAKGLALADAVEGKQRAEKAANIMGAIIDGDASPGGGEITASVHGLAQKFIESAEYKGYRENLAGAPSNTVKDIRLPSVKLGSYAEVIEGKAAVPALVTGDAFLPAQRVPMVDQTIKDELTLMDLVSKGRVDSNSLQYVQVVSVTRNAALQPENTGDPATDKLKPISELATNLQTANVFGYADGYVVTTQMLSDAAAFATFMDGELRYGIRAVQEDMLLNGSGTGGEPTGILNTTGIQSLTYDGTGATPIRNLVEKARTGIRMVRQKGGTTSAILLNPEDNEEIDLMTDANGNYIFGGPAAVGAQTLWGRPRVVSDKVEKGNVLLGDFKQAAYLDREGVRIEAFNQHEDFARRNLVYVRAEARGMQVVWRPARLLLLEKA